MSATRSSLLVALIGLAPLGALAAPGTSSAYVTDAQSSHVQDQTSDGISQVNTITCYISSMRPDALVNQGDYIALIDKNVCEAQRGGSASASQAPDYQSAVVNSTRTTNNDPMRAKVWIDQTQDNHADRIYANLSATEAPTSANPYGVFRLDFCAKLLSGATGCMENGYLEGSNGGISYYDIGSYGPGQTATTALQLSTNGTTSGNGEMSIVDPNQNAQFAFAFNATLFRRSNGSNDQCFSRDATDPATGLSVWRYGLYDAATGARFDRNSGFPVNFTSGGVTYNAFIGYWGLSAPGNVLALMTSGSTVDKVTYTGTGAATTPYTLVRAPGKLTKYTKKTTTLKDFDKIRFTTWVGTVPSSPFTTPNSMYELYWDQANGTFMVSGVFVCNGGNGCVTSSMTPQPVDASIWAAQGGINGSSQSFGGEVFINLQPVSGIVNAGNSLNVPVVYRVQDVVYPDAMPAALYCINNCPTAATLQSYFAPGSGDPSPFGTSFSQYGATPLGNLVTYSTDAAAAMLVDGLSQPVVLADPTLMSSNNQYMNGVMSGRLFTDPTTVLCPNDPTSYCDYMAADLPDYYVWQTGPNPWTEFAAVKDATGAYVKFDAPLQVNFTVPSGTAYGSYAGTTMVLQYGGFGQLWGIPGNCVSPLDNSTVSCNTTNARYVPAFVIPFDQSTGVVVDGSTSYLVKWLDREIRFAKKTTADCDAAGLVVPTNVVLPPATVLQDTTDPASPVYIGDKPVVTGDPRVIQGEVKY